MSEVPAEQITQQTYNEVYDELQDLRHAVDWAFEFGWKPLYADEYANVQLRHAHAYFLSRTSTRFRAAQDV